MALAELNDENLLRLYDNIRDQVSADRMHKHKFMSGGSVRQYADQLRSEITKRRLRHAPIDWFG